VNEARWEKLKSFIAERTHQPLGPDDGYSAEDVLAAEAYLGVSFPEALRELYMLIGRRDELVRDFNGLIALENLERDETDVTEDGEPYLCFWADNVSAMFLGILLHDQTQPDPIVQWISDLGEIDPELSQYTVAENALAIVALELTHGEAYGYLLNETDAQRAEIVQAAHPHSTPLLRKMGFLQLGQVLLMNVGHLLASAPTKEILRNTLEPLGHFTLESFRTEP
jgi:hypothetical protein